MTQLPLTPEQSESVNTMLDEVIPNDQSKKIQSNIEERFKELTSHVIQSMATISYQEKIIQKEMERFAKENLITDCGDKKSESYDLKKVKSQTIEEKLKYYESELRALMIELFSDRSILCRTGDPKVYNQWAKYNDYQSAVILVRFIAKEMDEAKKKGVSITTFSTPYLITQDVINIVSSMVKEEFPLSIMLFQQFPMPFLTWKITVDFSTKAFVKVDMPNPFASEPKKEALILPQEDVEVTDLPPGRMNKITSPVASVGNPK